MTAREEDATGTEAPPDGATPTAGRGGRGAGRVRSALSRLSKLPFRSVSRRAGTVDPMSTATTTTDDPEVLEAIAERIAPLADRELLIGLDVDGTLVDHHGMMSPRIYEALRRAAERHHVVIATGRSIGATLPIVRAAGVRHGYAVCSNGGVTLRIDPDAPDGFRVDQVRSFTPGNALAALRRAAPGAGFAVESPSGAFYSTGQFQDSSFGVRAIPTAFEDLIELDAVRVVVHDPDLTAAEFGEIVRSAGVHGVEYAIGTTAWLDMAAPGVSKATGLEAIRERLGLPEGDSVAMGDGFNDTEMLRWAGVGVAMGQALDGVIDAADLRTSTIWDDGSALVLEALTA